MRFEEVLPKLREGKKAKLARTLYKIDDEGDLMYRELQRFEDVTYIDESYDEDWRMACLHTWDILSEDWEIVQDAESKA